MNKAIILVGNIGCGKSTLTKELAKLGYNIICRDSLRYMIGGGTYKFDPKTEPFIKEANLSIVREAVSKELSFVIDETNVFRKIRKSYLDIILESSHYKVIAVELPRLSKEEAVDRRMINPHDQSDSALWESVWELFNNNYQTPRLDEGFEKVVSLGKNFDITQLLKELK